MEGRPRLKRGRGGREGREGKGKGGKGREEGDIGGPRDILSRGPPVPSYATGLIGKKSRNFYTPPVFSAPSGSDGPRRNFVKMFDADKTRMIGLPYY